MTSVSTSDARANVAVPLAALLAGAAAMGVSPVFVRLADVGPFASAFWRVVLALPLLWAWTAASERAAGTAAPKRFSRATLAAGLMFSADLFFWHLAILHTTVANATFFATTAPLWVVLFGWLLFGERVPRAVLGGLALCLLGGASLVGVSVSVDLSRVPGDLQGVACGLFFGLYFLAVRGARRDAGAARVTFELSLVTAVLLGTVALATEHALLPHGLSGWAVLLALAWISHAGGQGLLSVALGRLPAVFSSLVIFLEAAVAALAGWVVLGEPVTITQGLGGFAILAGIWVARPRR